MYFYMTGVTNSTGTLPEGSEQPDYILGTAHCKDMYSPKPDDPAELTFARQQIAAAVASWLAK